MIEYKQASTLEDVFPIVNNEDGEYQYIRVNRPTEDNLETTIQTDTFQVEFNHTLNDVKKIVDDVLISMPALHFTYRSSDPDTQNNELSVWQTRGSNTVARLTRRGPANYQYGNTYYYRGSYDDGIDSPVIILKNSNDMYGIFIHPNVKDYGFTLVNDDE